MDSLVQLRQLRIEASEIKFALWQQSFLTPKWWFIAIVIAVSYIIWWKLADKKRIIELLLFGSFIAVSRVIFDAWGVTSGRWAYIIDLLPLGISLFLNDLTVVPLTLMLAYQYSLTWTRYLLLVLVTQSAIVFGFMPLLVSIGILEIYNWQVAYTFIFMVIIGIVMRAIMLFGLQIQKNSRLEYSGSTSVELIPQPAMKPLDRNKDNNDKENE